MAKKVTLEDLALMTGKGFLEMGKKFSGLENRMGGLENRMGGLENRMGGLENRMGGLENRMGGLENRMGGLEKRTDKLEKTIKQGFENTRTRLDLLEKEVKLIRERLDHSISRDEFFELENRLTFVEEKLGIKY